VTERDKKGRKDELDDLRKRAEARLAQSDHVGDSRDPSPNEADTVIHELQTHQVELELQNEDLREAQLALTEAHDRYVDLYDFAPVGYVTLDGAGKVIEANLRAAELLAQPRAELTGRVFASLVAEDDQDALFLCMRNLRSKGGRHEVDLRLRQPEPDERWTRTEWVQEKGEGQHDRVRVTLSDITEHKRLQARLALADRLSSVGLLAASIGHEVNNPLTYVLYNLETMVDDLPKMIRRLADHQVSKTASAADQALGGWLSELSIELQDIHERAASAVEGAQRIRDLVKGMRAFSRVDEELIEPVSFNNVVETALMMTAREISCRARLNKDLGNVPRVSANQGQMCQVFVNLLVNAAHAIEEGHVEENKITVRTWSEDGDVLGEVSDTGCGISAANLDKVFDPFFTTKPVGSGTGLGLSIAMKIVHALGGQLSVESKEGKGTKFTIRLPATAAEPETTDAFEKASPGGELLRGRILVIDDEALVRETVVQMLSEQEVVVASSGREGKEVLSRDTGFDVILCDLMMPDVSGMELVAWLETREPSLLKRVVFVTGGAFTPRAHDFLAKGDYPRLDKPFGRDRLLHTVQRTMKATRQP
jgi:PAS domain S-box-containing protein